MYAVITAGGKGTRVASINHSVPKPLLPIAGKPVLQHQIESLRRQGFERVTFTIGYLGDIVREYFGDGGRFGIKIDYIQEDVPLGTAGALYFLKGLVEDDFFLINGDLIFDVDLDRMFAFHKANHALATLLVHPNDHPYDSSLVMASSEGRVCGWLDKEKVRGWYRNRVNAGIHILSPSLLKGIEQPQKLDLDKDILKPLIPSGEVYAYRTPEYVKDMGTPDRIAQVERDLQNGLVRQKNLSNPQRAVFLDRDGTINRYVGFLKQPEEFQLLDGVAKAVRYLNQSGYLTIVVTNQPVIARGDVTWEQLEEIHRKMETLLGQEGAYLDAIFVCPHHPDSGFPGEVPAYKLSCDCRKPKPGLLLQAAREYNINLSKSWMIGDSQRDIEAGQSAGCQTILVSETFTLKDAVKILNCKSALERQAGS